MNSTGMHGLKAPTALFQSLSRSPVQAPGQLSRLQGGQAPLSHTPTLGKDHFSGVSRLLTRQGRLPDATVTLSPAPQSPATSPSPTLSLPVPDMRPLPSTPVSSLTPPLNLPIPTPRPSIALKSVSALAPISSLRPQARPDSVALKPRRQPLDDTFTYQFGEIGKHGSRMEAQGNCGPAVASMLIKHFGVNPPTMRQLRRQVGARTGNGRGLYAISTEQIGKAVKDTLKAKNIDVDFKVHSLSSNVDRALEKMRAALDRGEKVVLLSSNMSSLSRGHYVIIKEVRADGSVVIDDPGKRRGRDNVYSKQRLSKALRTRVNRYGRQNNLITVKEK